MAPSLAETKLAFFQANAGYPETTLAEAEKSYYGPLQSVFTPWQLFTLADVKLAALQSLTGKTGSLQDLELLWLMQNSGPPDGSMSDEWNQAQQTKSGQDILKTALLWLDLQQEPQTSTKQSLTNFGSLGSAGNAQVGSTTSNDTNDPVWLPYTGEKYVYVPSGSSALNAITKPSSPVVTLQDVDIRVRIDRPAIEGYPQTELFAKTGNLTTQGGWTFLLQTDSGLLRFAFSLDNAGVGTFNEINTPIPGTVYKWYRVTRVISGLVSFYGSNDGVNWVTIAANIAGNPGYFYTNYAALGTSIGVASAGTKFYRAEVRNGVNGPIVEYWDANNNNGWTVTRAASGYKSTLVERPCFLLSGTDDWLMVPSNAAFSFTGTSPFTLLSVVRVFDLAGNAYPQMMHRDGANAGDPGWGMGFWGATLQPYLGVDNTTNVLGPFVTSGVTSTVIGRRTPSSFQVITNGAQGQPTPLGAINGNNSLLLRLGESVTGGNALTAEWYGTAIWNRALTDAEIASVTAYFNSIPSPVEALLSEAALFLDAKTYSGSGNLLNKGSLGTAGDAQLGSAAGADTNDPTWLPWIGEDYVFIPGVAGNTIWGPTGAPASGVWDRLSGDFDVRVHAEFISLPSGYGGLLQVLNAGINFGWLFRCQFGTLVWSAIGLTPTGTATVTVAETVWKWWRVTRVASTGTVTFYGSNDGTSWTQIGTPQPTTPGPVPNMNRSDIFPAIGEHNPIGKFFEVIALNGINGSPIIQWKASQMGQTGGVDSLGYTWAFTHSSASAYTAALVKRPSFLFAVDDHMSIPDNAFLDFGIKESFTLMAACRIHENAPPAATTLFSKRTSAAGGYDLTWWQPNDIRFLLQDNAGANAPVDSVNTVPIHELAVYTGQRIINQAGTSGIVQVRSQLKKGPGVADTTFDKQLDTTQALVIGLGVNGVLYWANMEFYGMALWRRALSDSEIQQAQAYFLGG